MGDHLRLSGQPPAVQREALEEMIRDQPVLMSVLEGMAELPDGLLVSGAIYNMCWNRLTGRPPLNGIADIDVFYFDADDLSYGAEDRVIRRLAERFAHLPLPVQVRNQARVHLWFTEKFGGDFTPLSSAAEMLGRFATRAHAVGARLNASGDIEIVAPFGLDDMFSFRMVPNRVLNNRQTHETKAARAKALWPELTIVPWDSPERGAAPGASA